MKRHTVYLSYEGGRPTLWDEPGPGRHRAEWADDGERIVVEAFPLEDVDARAQAMRETCEVLASCLEVGFEGCPDFEGRDVPDMPKRVDSIYANGVSLEMVIDGETYVAEFRHVDDEVV